MKTFIIKYYHTETQYRCGIVAYSETVRGSRDAAALAVKNDLKNREVDIKTLRAELKKGCAFISD